MMSLCQISCVQLSQSDSAESCVLSLVLGGVAVPNIRGRLRPRYETVLPRE